jgi:hypothetical protein
VIGVNAIILLSIRKLSATLFRSKNTAAPTLAKITDFLLIGL